MILRSISDIIKERISGAIPERIMERKDKMRPKYLVTALLSAAIFCSCTGCQEGSVSSSDNDVQVVTTTTAAETTDTASVTTTGSEEATADNDPDTPQNTSTAPELDISVVANAIPDISVSYEDKCIHESGTANGYNFELFIDLNKWDGNTTLEQISKISQLFWECYPRMYDRFGIIAKADRTVTIAIENEDYYPAYTLGNWIHLHDQRLLDEPEDFDVVTHELTHVIQNDWNADACEFSEYIERFADFCRYEYAFQDGLYNDACWTLWEADEENSLAASNRFFVWLDYTYSTPENDIMLNFFRVCSEGRYASNDWDKAWEEIFAGSALEGRHIYDVWTEFTKTDFAYLSATSSDGPSELLKRYDIRGRLK